MTFVLGGYCWPRQGPYTFEAADAFFKHRFFPSVIFDFMYECADVGFMEKYDLAKCFNQRDIMPLLEMRRVRIRVFVFL